MNASAFHGGAFSETVIYNSSQIVPHPYVRVPAKTSR
ncbi:hypothetical protein SAMN06269250_3437 [Spirosoma fluviale]|uniref:Uncharacterized protein n=1 Tax=Spirosoma fluviale TaxID=1597977 RepID=A0A286G4K6_9BACT|nr:hypothetical protein SAMN06269250_3437 [Spirosoma fluviale]